MSLRQFFKRACGVAAYSVSIMGLCLALAQAQNQQAPNQQDVPAPKLYKMYGRKTGRILLFV